MHIIIFLYTLIKIIALLFLEVPFLLGELLKSFHNNKKKCIRMVITSAFRHNVFHVITSPDLFKLESEWGIFKRK